MSTTSPTEQPTPTGVPSSVLPRLINEGHTTGAWHGSDFLTAIAGVEAAAAVRRPAPGRHSIGEITLHHAFWIRVVRGRLTGVALEPFVLEGEDWFEWSDESRLSWVDVRQALLTELERLRDTVQAINAGLVKSPLSPEKRFDQVLGIAMHAAYHAGQVELVKKLV
jgi:hypothetical protein